VSPADLTALRGRRIVEARLGREPQDMLEAAVALEAWAGMPPADALAQGRRIVTSQPPAPQPSAGRLPAPAPQRGIAIEAVSFIIAVIAIACWAGPLSGRLGSDVVETAIILALPTTLALQWGLASRYLSRPDGIASMGSRPLLLVVAAAAIIVVPTLLLGRTGALAGLLTVTWTGGTIVIRRHWSLAYAAMMILASAAMVAGLPATNVLGGTAALTIVAVALAVRARVVETGAPPGRWGRALVAALIGAAIGALLMVDRSVDWSLGSLPAIGLLPSSVASFWAGYHLWRFQQVLPETLSGVPLAGVDSPALRRPGLAVLRGAVARLVGLTAALSLVLLAGAEALGLETTGTTVLAGFGLVALATLLSSLLEAVGRGAWALAALAAGIAAAVTAQRLPDVADITGGGLIVGAAVAAMLALPVAIAMLCRPATTLATALGIR
jgi:hypothetical protein